MGATIVGVMIAAHRQEAFRVRFDWGPDGARAIAAGADVAVVIDVLSFTTTVSVALDRGIAIRPHPWRDASVEAVAREHDAALAVGRSRAGPGALSLSPASIRAHCAPPARLVLPSPNGATIAHELAGTGVACVGGCLRNATAVAGWLARERPGATVAVLAAGERWPGGALRPAVEDGWGAGAVLAALAATGAAGFSPEADAAVAGYAAVRGHLGAALAGCASGRELVAGGYGEDVAIAAEVDSTALVPVLVDGWFGPAG